MFEEVGRLVIGVVAGILVWFLIVCFAACIQVGPGERTWQEFLFFSVMAGVVLTVFPAINTIHSTQEPWLAGWDMGLAGFISSTLFWAYVLKEGGNPAEERSWLPWKH